MAKIRTHIWHIYCLADVSKDTDDEERVKGFSDISPDEKQNSITIILPVSI